MNIPFPSRADLVVHRGVVDDLVGDPDPFGLGKWNVGFRRAMATAPAPHPSKSRRLSRQSNSVSRAMRQWRSPVLSTRVTHTDNGDLFVWQVSVAAPVICEALNHLPRIGEKKPYFLENPY